MKILLGLLLLLSTARAQSLTFNPLTGQFDFVGAGSAGSGLTGIAATGGTATGPTVTFALDFTCATSSITRSSNLITFCFPPFSNLPFRTDYTFATVLTLAANCGAAPNTCQFRFGNNPTQSAAPGTCTVSAGTGTMFEYIATDGRIKCGSNGLTLACSAGCDVTTSISAFPTTSIPLYTWTATAGVWDASGSTDYRAILSTKNVTGGTGINCVDSGGLTTCSLVAQTRGLSFTFDGGGSAIASGKTIYLRIPLACTIANWSILSDVAETVTIKTWKIASGTAIPTVANSISTSGVSLSSGTAVVSSTVSDFTSTAVTGNDLMAANITAITAATFVNFVLGCTQ